MLLVVGVEFERPDVRLEGGLTADEILLGAPSSDVGLLLRGVVQTGVDGRSDGGETGALEDFGLLDGYIPQNRVYMLVTLS